MFAVGCSMGRFFGTDGFRGRVGEGLTAMHAYEVGRQIGHTYAGKKVLIGQDTRASGGMLACAMAAGITSGGADAYMIGVTTTAGVSHLTQAGGYAAGVMLSASHNPYHDNGIKLFGGDGEKPSDRVVADIERHLTAAAEGNARLPYAPAASVGRVVSCGGDKGCYTSYLVGKGCCSLAGVRVILDCAHGSACAHAEEVFSSLGADVLLTGATPDGCNINEGVGSTHIAHLAAMVQMRHADVGFAFDGDADRCIAVDAQGRTVDGDGILYLSALDMQAHGALAENTVVGTVLSGAGLECSLRRAGIDLARTAVGDRNVRQYMKAKGLSLGGERSGHIIYAADAVTGDGLLTAVKVLGIMTKRDKALSELVAGLETFPCAEESIPSAAPAALLRTKAVQRAISEAERLLAGRGRLLVRPSGTEPLLRVMCEAEDAETCVACAAMIKSACEHAE